MSGVGTDSTDPENNEESQDSQGSSVNRPIVPTVAIPQPHGAACIVCNMFTFGVPGIVWIQPCRCGYWVHDQCLIDVTMHYEDYNPGTRTLGCRICRRTYNISPVKSQFQKYVEKCSNVWYQGFCYFVMDTLTVLVSDVVFIKFGVLVLKEVYGEHAEVLIYSTTPERAILMCQLIPVTCIVVSSIPWEHQLLKMLRMCSRLPLIGGVFPTEDREVPDIYEDSSTFHRNLIGGLLLPFFATVTSRLFNGFVMDPFIRFLLGGGTIVVLKGVCKMYYKQKKYSRYCRLTVTNFTITND